MIGFTGSRLDRADALRGDDAALARMRADPAARLLPLTGLDPVPRDGDPLGWVTLGEALATPLAFLGLLDDAPRFVALAEPGVHAARRSDALSALLPTLAPEDASTFAAARSLVDWHARHRYCANCGGATEIKRAGWARRCLACETEHYPRTDPVAIMLAEHDGRVLIGRQRSWPEARFSALAGFVEAGESLEEAVRRELYEEAGVVAGRVRYLASQPWPFPSQLMLACVADVADPTLRVDQTELETAMWVSRDEVRDALAEAESVRFRLPPSYAIAHTLLTMWAEAGG